jgi:hypothetical protein
MAGRTDDGDGDQHVRLDLGLYALGALSADEAATVERHLGRCVPCSDEAAGLAEVCNRLAYLCPHEIAQLLGEQGTDDDAPAPF